MTIAVVAVLVILVGLPLAAVWWSRRAFWSRLRPGRDPDTVGDVRRAHGLTPVQMARVESAVLWGRRLDDPRERAALIDLARSMQPDPRTSRWVSLQLPVAVTGAVLLVAGAGYNVATEGWSEFPWSALLWIIPAGAVWAGPRRAIRRNRD